MVWSQIDVNKPHLVYIVLGGFTTLFMLCSSIIKERLYIGEATVATLCGIIFGPHAAGLIDPASWGNVDQITLEFSRVVLVVQCFAVGVELPKAYMERHWRSVSLLLIPVMTFGWLITSLFIWGLFSPSLNWLDSLCIAACVTATDPVLASSVVGKGKFAKRVPRHLRDLLSAESGCNDGMAFPFIYLPLYLIKYRPDASEVAYHWICYTILYECIFGAVYGVCLGYAARRAIRYAHEHNYVDRESFLVFYFVLALFCAGSGSILGVDDLLVGFATGVGFSNDGWFTEKTEETHVSNVIDLLINLSFFVYFGTIIPWAQYNSHILQLDVWRLVVLGFLVLFFRRIPIMMLVKPLVPDIKTWREALFAGHFGPIGVGAIFVAILARGELETEFESTTPLAELPEPGFPHYNIIEMIWPITTFLVICSIVVHGSSIAVFTLGKHINTLSLTMSYTQAQETSWMDRLPRIQSRSKSSMSAQRSDDENDFDDKEKGYPPGMDSALVPGTFLRRQKEEDNPSRSQSRASSRRRHRRNRTLDGMGPGGPISQSAIAPARKHEESELGLDTRSDSDTLNAKTESPQDSDGKLPERRMTNDTDDDGRARDDSDDDSGPGEVYEEGSHTVYEDKEGNVLAVEPSPLEEHPGNKKERAEIEKKEGERLMKEDHKKHPTRHHKDITHQAGHCDKPEEEGEKKKFSTDAAKEKKNEKEKEKNSGSSKDADAAPSSPRERPGKAWRSGIKKFGTLTGISKADSGEASEKPKPEAKPSRGPARAYQYGKTIILEDEDGEVIRKFDIPVPDKKSGEESAASQKRINQMGRMLGLGGGKAAAGAEDGESGDERMRFTMMSGGRRMSKAEFIDQIRQMDPKSRVEAVEESDAPEKVKQVARAEAREQGAASGGPTRIREDDDDDDDDEGKNPKSRSKKSDSAAGSEVPLHDISAELRKLRGPTDGPETAASRRRRRAQRTDSEDDELEIKSAGAPVPSSSKQQQQAAMTTDETAAERRRREGALGLRREEDESESEEDSNEPRALKGAPGSQGTEAGRTGRTSTLRWGANVGR